MNHIAQLRPTAERATLLNMNSELPTGFNRPVGVIQRKEGFQHTGSRNCLHGSDTDCPACVFMLEMQQLLSHLDPSLDPDHKHLLLMALADAFLRSQSAYIKKAATPSAE